MSETLWDLRPLNATRRGAETVLVVMMIQTGGNSLVPDLPSLYSKTAGPKNKSPIQPGDRFLLSPENYVGKWLPPGRQQEQKQQRNTQKSGPVNELINQPTSTFQASYDAGH